MTSASTRPRKSPLFFTGGWVIDFNPMPRDPRRKWGRLHVTGRVVRPFETKDEARRWMVNRAHEYLNNYRVRHIWEAEEEDLTAWTYEAL